MKEVTNKIANYKEARDVEAYHNTVPGNQPEDPEKAAELMMFVAESEVAPLHLFLGSDSVGLSKGKLETVRQAANMLLNSLTADISCGNTISMKFSHVYQVRTEPISPPLR